MLFVFQYSEPHSSIEFSFQILLQLQETFSQMQTRTESFCLIQFSLNHLYLLIHHLFQDLLKPNDLFQYYLLKQTFQQKQPYDIQMHQSDQILQLQPHHMLEQKMWLPYTSWIIFLLQLYSRILVASSIYLSYYLLKPFFSMQTFAHLLSQIGIWHNFLHLKHYLTHPYILLFDCFQIQVNQELKQSVFENIVDQMYQILYFLYFQS